MAATARRWGLLGGPGISLDQCKVGVGHPEELSVVGALGPLVEALDDLVDEEHFFHGLKVERRHAGQGDLGNDAQCPEAHPGDMQEVRIGGPVAVNDGAVAGDHAQPDHPVCDAAEPQTGAVGRGGDGSGHRLVVDIAQVGHGQAGRLQVGVEVAESDTGPDPDQSAVRVEVVHIGQPVKGDQHFVGGGDAGERVAGSDRADPETLGGGGSYDGDDLVLTLRAFDPHRVGDLVARPVAPGAVGADTPHRRHQPRRSTGQDSSTSASPPAETSSTKWSASCLAIVGSM